MSRRLFYHGRRKDNPTPIRTKVYAQAMFFFALGIMFLAALYKQPF